MLLVAGGGQLVLVDALDAHLLGGDGRVLAHRQPGARLAVGRDLDAERRGQLADQLEPVDVRLGPAQPEQHAAQVVAERDRRVGGGVHTARGRRRRSDPARCRWPRRWCACRPGAAGLLQVEGGGVRRQRAAEHAFAHQVEVAAVLEHRAADHRAEPLALEIEAVDQPAERGGEHVLVGRVGVRAVGACERESGCRRGWLPVGCLCCWPRLRASVVGFSRVIVPTVLTLE